MDGLLIGPGPFVDGSLVGAEPFVDAQHNWERMRVAEEPRRKGRKQDGHIRLTH